MIDLLLELVVQVVVELLLEGFFEGVGRVVERRVGRLVLSGLCGLGFGLAWGAYLDGRAAYPRLLWVSLALAAVAALLAVVHPGTAVESGWRAVLVPPWRWSRERLVNLVVLNLALAGGIVLTFTPAP